MNPAVSSPCSLNVIRPLRVTCLGLAALVCAASAPPALSAAPNQPDKVARGKYLVTIAGCNDCHTPWTPGLNGAEPDMTRMLSGHPEGLVMPSPPELPEGPWLVTAGATNTAWSGPWGVSFTANLTPDPETGLGRWTLRDFIDTMRTGRHLGRGRPILPPMPIPNYKHFTDADLAAIFSYLKTIPPIHNRVPDPLPVAATAMSRSDMGSPAAPGTTDAGLPAPARTQARQR